MRALCRKRNKANCMTMLQANCFSKKLQDNQDSNKQIRLLGTKCRNKFQAISKRIKVHVKFQAKRNKKQPNVLNENPKQNCEFNEDSENHETWL